MKPLVSIIIPTYNRAHLIGETLDSVIAQTYQNWECIVVDDGSSDYTNELLEFYCEKDSRFRYLLRPIEPKGASHCRNVGLKEAEGEFCIFLDSDDLLLDYCLKERLNSIENFLENDFWVFPMFAKKEGENSHPKPIPRKNSYLEDFLSCHLFWQTMCTLWKKDFIVSLKGFNIQYPRLNDPEIHIRAIIRSKKNFKVFYDIRPDSIYRWASSLEVRAELAKKFHFSLKLFIPDISEVLKKNQYENRLPLLKGYLKEYIQISSRFIDTKGNLELFRIFRGCGVLSIYEYINLYLFYRINLVLKRGANRAKREMVNILYSHDG